MPYRELYRVTFINNQVYSVVHDQEHRSLSSLDDVKVYNTPSYLAYALIKAFSRDEAHEKAKEIIETFLSEKSL